MRYNRGALCSGLEVYRDSGKKKVAGGKWQLLIFFLRIFLFVYPKILRKHSLWSFFFCIFLVGFQISKYPDRISLEISYKYVCKYCIHTCTRKHDTKTIFFFILTQQQKYSLDKENFRIGSHFHMFFIWGTSSHFLGTESFKHDIW